MSDSSFDADRSAGEYPPKDWGWKDVSEQRDLLVNHFDNPNTTLEPWMYTEAFKLKITHIRLENTL